MAGTFPVGQRAARSLSERWPAVLPWVSFLSVQGHQRAHLSSFGPCPVADFFLGGPVTGEGTAKGWLRGLSRYPGVPIMKKCPDYRGSRLRTIRLGCSCPNGAGFATKVAITDMFEIQSSQLARIQWRPGRRVAWPRRALQHKSGLRVVPLKAQAIGCAGDSHIIDPSSACIRLRDQIESEVSRSCRSTTVSSAVSARDPTGNCSTVARWPVHKRVTSATCPSGNSRAS